jgi:hypothetical protein
MGLIEGGGGGERGGGGRRRRERPPEKDKQFSSLPSLQVLFQIIKQYVNYKKSYTKGSEMSFLA